MINDLLVAEAHGVLGLVQQRFLVLVGVGAESIAHLLGGRLLAL
jgi:hypothetical protein